MNTLTNMFSMFDPSSSYSSISWMILFTLPYILKKMKMKTNSKMKKAILLTMSSMTKELKELMKKNKKFSNELMVKMFSMVLILNMMALTPFIFTPTAHISFTFTMSLSLWMSTILLGWVKEYKNSMVHLTPTGTPFILMNFMVLIELVSMLIRPITLSVRLSANMVAGHLLMALLSNFSLISKNKLVMSIFPMMILTILETMVAAVQAYVIMTLMTLYQNESIK